MKSSSSTPNFFFQNFSFPKESDYNNYSNKLNNTMKKYSPNKTKEKEDEDNREYILNMDNSKKYVTIEEKNFIKKYTDKKQEYDKYYNINYYNSCNENNLNDENKKEFINPTLRVSIISQRYLSPIHSLGTIKLNNSIYEDLTKSNIERQKIKYNEYIQRIESYKYKSMVKMPKIRITMMNSKLLNKLPKIIKNKKEYSNMINNHSNIRNNDNDSSFAEKKNTKNENDKHNSNISKLKDIPNKLFSYYKYPKKNFPECREQSTLNINNNSEIYLIGGISTIMKSMQIWILNLETITWKKKSSNNLFLNRFGHTSIYDKERNKIYIFGGKTKFNNNENNSFNSGIFCGLDILNLNNFTFISPLIPTRNSPQLRRNHIAEMIGNHMIIHGGISEDNEILNDIFLLDLNVLNNNLFNNNSDKWSKCLINNKYKSPYLFGHSSCLVIPKKILENDKFSIFKFPDDYIQEMKIKKNVMSENIKIKGWYIFGGKKKNESEKGISNDLYILKLGNKILKFVKIKTNGKKPLPRYFHSMNFYENGNFIIIHGGRNDFNNESFALNDTFILNLYNFDWIKIILYNNFFNFKVLNRCAHSSIIYNNKLIIFGGMNNNNYLGSILFIINLDVNYNVNNKSNEESILDEIKKDENNFYNDNNIKDKVNQFKIMVENNQSVDTNLPNIK